MLGMIDTSLDEVNFDYLFELHDYSLAFKKQDFMLYFLSAEWAFRQLVCTFLAA